uniref:START domain-containing protein n=1 Tax=Strigops habroptila TaxID=2489341 RepID=A0A672UM36_STRHB
MGLGGQTRGLGAPTLYSLVPRGLQHISKPALGTSPVHGAETVTGAIGERLPEIDGTCHTRISCKDVPAETLYDVLHDTDYRKKWDSNMIETYDIGRLTVNADHRACPLKNRDFVTLRSWLPLGNDYMIINYSVKHPKYPPRKDFVRAVSLQTGYLIKANGTGACILYYLTQVDPRGECQQEGKAMKKIYKAGLKYPEWKRKHDPGYKPWVYPEQNTLPSVSLAELSVQHADSLENIDETGLPEDHLSTSDHEA